MSRAVRYLGDAGAARARDHATAPAATASAPTTIRIHHGRRRGDGRAAVVDAPFEGAAARGVGDGASGGGAAVTRVEAASDAPCREISLNYRLSERSGAWRRVAGEARSDSEARAASQRHLFEQSGHMPWVKCASVRSLR